MTVEPVAYFSSPLPDKFGLPRQSGLAPSLRGEVHFTEALRRPEAVRGLEGFDRIWLIWSFDRNPRTDALTVRPPRLGGNRSVGVFASRSPFRPNGIGLSCVRLESVEMERADAPVLVVSGADLADGTPILDIKPYVAYADAFPDSRCGFVDSSDWHTLEVEVPASLKAALGERDAAALEEILRQDPRPGYQNDPDRVYGMTFCGRNIRFKVDSDRLTVID